jgi:hypothetical protein
MTYELSNEEKTSIVNQHLRSLEYNKYNVQVSLKEENAVADKNVDLIASLNSQVAVITDKIDALLEELASL